jgi:hypothetical protein
MPDVHTLESIINFGNQPIPVALNVEYGPPVHRICIRESFPNISKTVPRCPLSDAKPNIQWGFEVCVMNRCFLELLAANYVQALTNTFALCELHYYCSSQIAKTSSI